MIFSLWPSMIQFDWPDHVPKKKSFLQESILLTPRKFFRSVSCSAWRPKLRSTARSAASSQVIFVPLMKKVSNDVDLKDNMSPITLVLLRSSLFNFLRFSKAETLPETLVFPRYSCSNFLRFFRANRSPETWVHPRLSCINSVRFFSASMSPETWVSLRLRTCRSGNSLKRGLRVPASSQRPGSKIFTTLQPSLGWETARTWWRSHGSRLCGQISIASFYPFLF